VTTVTVGVVETDETDGELTNELLTVYPDWVTKAGLKAGAGV
jgi:hypothetical protein